jgi:hypothetical protein
MRELKMHPKELSLKDGELQIKDVQEPKGEGNLEARMEALEQEVFKYKKMAVTTQKNPLFRNCLFFYFCASSCIFTLHVFAK